MSTTDLQRARKGLQALVGETCTRVMPGIGDITSLYIDLGRAVGVITPSTRSERKRPVYQFSVGTISAWRLERADRVLCSFDDEKPRGGAVWRALMALKGRKVKRVDITGPAGDLAVYFHGGLTLRAFCLIRNGDPEITWDYTFGDHTPGRKFGFTVGPRGRIRDFWLKPPPRAPKPPRRAR